MVAPQRYIVVIKDSYGRSFTVFSGQSAFDAWWNMSGSAAEARGSFTLIAKGVTDTEKEVLLRFGRAMCAGSTRTPLSELLCLSRDSSEAVQARLLGNKEFRHYATDLAYSMIDSAERTPTWVTFQAIAWSPYLTEELYSRVYALGEWYILIGLANNPACPPKILDEMSKDTRPGFEEVASVARRRIADGRPL